MTLMKLLLYPSPHSPRPAAPAIAKLACVEPGLRFEFDCSNHSCVFGIDLDRVYQ